MAVAENELHQVELLRAPHPSAEDEEAERLVALELAELPELSTHQCCPSTRAAPLRSELTELSELLRVDSRQGPDRQTDRPPASQAELQSAGRPKRQSTEQGRDASLASRHLSSSLQALAPAPAPPGRPSAAAAAPVATLTLDANDEALIAEIAEMACGD